MNRDTDLAAADVLAALDAGLMTGLVLAVEHFALWGVQQQHLQGYKRPVAYVLGTVTLLAGFWRWALLRQRTGAALALTLLVGVAGTFDIACYCWRAWQDRADEAAFGAAGLHLAKGWRAVGNLVHNNPTRS